jgi:ribosomal protein S18 acetylase RimI-like enzyme
VELRPFGGPADGRARQRLASLWWPRCWHPGGVGWEEASGQLPDPLMMAVDGGGVAGWAGLAGRELLLSSDPARPAAAAALAAWAVTAAGPGELTAPVFDGDQPAAAALEAHGFTRPDEPAPLEALFRPARAAAPELPPGYRVRSVRDGEETARVEAHRKAWRPIDMPWPGERPASATPEATSRFTMDHYQQCRRTWLYDQSRDLVIEAPGGELAACCILWWDPATGTGEIEPLGVAPAHRRRGLATALCAAAGSLVADLGGADIHINTAPSPRYPAPAQTYLAAGFELRRRGEYLRRPADPARPA